jgi:hypothetical protein
LIVILQRQQVARSKAAMVYQLDPAVRVFAQSAKNLNLPAGQSVIRFRRVAIDDEEIHSPANGEPECWRTRMDFDQLMLLG